MQNYSSCKNIIFQDNVNFDTYTMRDHLIKCIESQQFSPFPKSPKTKPTRTKVLSLKNTSVNFSIEKECTARCNLPNLLEDMVCCDRYSAWYHYGCVPSNNSNTFSGSLSFTCSNCSSTPQRLCVQKTKLSVGHYHSWWDVFSKAVPIAGLTKSLNEMIFIFFINIC